MTEQTIMGRRWNLFARELEDILTTHNLSMGQLDDQVGIHREKVRRTQTILADAKKLSSPQ